MQNGPLITITGFGTAKDMLSGKEADCVQVEFQDGSLKGPVSFKTLEKLIRARAESNGRPETLPFQPQQQ